jgi:putative DNA primase/helicase
VNNLNRPPGRGKPGPGPSAHVNGKVHPEQRFSNGRECPICHGSEDARRGSGERCHGFLSEDGEWAHCTHEEYAGQAKVRGGSGTYAHLLKGKCPCGTEHAPAEPKPKRPKTGRGRIAKVYPYADAAGRLLFEVVRTADPKGFYQRRPSSKGDSRVNGLGDIVPVPYRLRELATADPAVTVHIPEGEKDVDALVALGLVATCNPMGAGKWRDAYSDHLTGRNVVILPDNDDAGRDHAQQVARSLRGKAASVKVVELPELPEKGDVSDWLAKGGTAEALGDLVREAPVWTPPAEADAHQAEADDVPRFAGGFDTETKGRPIIRITPDFHMAVRDAAEALAGHPDVFTRGGELARVIRHPGNREDEKGLRRDCGAPLILPMEVDTARVWLSCAARFQKFDKRNQDWEFTTPTRDFTASILGLRSYQAGRELVGIIEAPTLRPGGSVVDIPGYDVATGLFYVPNATFPAIPEHPTLIDARTAVAFILRLVTDFPFSTNCDRAAWLAYLLTVVARGAIDGPVPMFLFSANVAGTGKSSLAELGGLIATGRYPALDGYAADDAEMEKRLTALAIAGDRCVILDNAENGARVGGPALDRAIMAKGSFRGRILGSSKMSGHDIPWSAVVSITGNNLSTRADTRRRVIPCYLKSSVAKPEERDPETFAIFRETGKDLERFVLDNRPALVAAALTIIRGFILAGRPKSGLKSRDFPAWSRLIRESVAWSYDFDPAGSIDRLEDEDETSSTRLRLMVAWRALCEAVDEESGETDDSKKAITRGLTTAEAGAKLAEYHAMKPGVFPFREGHASVVQAFSMFAPKGASVPDATRLGFALRRENGAPTECGTLKHHPPYRGTRRWYVDDWTPPKEDT